MLTPFHPPPRMTNRLLCALSSSEYTRRRPDLQSTHLTRGKVLYESGEHVAYCYFAASGMVSLLSTIEDGSTIEVGVVGDEGLIGVPAILSAGATPYRMVVQVGADAVRIKAAALKREFDRGEMLHDLLLRYTHALLCQTAQTAVCNRFHTIEQRLCRWLLISRDCVHTESFPLTHEFLSQMLSVPRTSVTMTAAALRIAGLIDYTRGRITITDSQGLEVAACECHRIVRREIETIFADQAENFSSMSSFRQTASIVPV